MAEYKTMREIGAEIGLTSHQVGRRLTALGLRVDRKPSPTARQEMWVEQYWSRDGVNYSWAWDAEKVKALFGVSKP